MLFGCKDSIIWESREGNKTKKESIIADELFLVTPTGFKPVTF